MAQQEEIKSFLTKELGLEIPGNDFEQIQRLLSETVNQLILTDLQRLINLLYRIDISEVRLRQLMKENTDQDAGKIIADLIIERQLEKIKMREKFKPGSDIPENERW